MPIKSFRGMLGDGDIDIISLHTNTGSTGYRIVKFQTFANDVTLKVQESVMKIFKIPQTTTSVSATVDFNDNTLLGVSYWKSHEDAATMFQTSTIFDNEVFNQDIYITHKDGQTGESCNYYIELEQIELDLTENTVATLKDIRNIESQSV